MNDWFYPAALAAVLFAFVAVIDKPLIGHMFPSFRAFSIAFGTMQLIRAVVLLAIAVPVAGFDGGSGVVWALAAGFLWAAGVTLFFYALSMVEVSRAAPMIATTPIFTATLAVLLLGDSMALAQWMGILAVVVGAVLINLRIEGGRLQLAHRRASVILLASAMTWAAAFVVTDQATERMNTLATEGLRSLTMGIGVVAFAWRPRFNRQVISGLRNRRTAALLLLSEGLLAQTVTLSLVYALSIGPVALVGAVYASSPLFVLLLSLGLSTPLWNVLDESLDRGTIAVKTAATFLIVGGVIAIRLSG